jgi:hypothetical protein
MGGNPDAATFEGCDGRGVHLMEVTVMTTHIETVTTVAVPRAARHLGWFAFGSLVAFLIPYVGVSVLDLQHDVFYLAYFALTLMLLAALSMSTRGACSPGTGSGASSSAWSPPQYSGGT